MSQNNFQNTQQINIQNKNLIPHPNHKKEKNKIKNTNNKKLKKVDNSEIIKNIFEKKIKPVFAIICILALLTQVVFGILYFKGLYYGRDYNTLLPYNWL